MKTKEQRKAELLDELMEYWNTIVDATGLKPHLTIRMTLEKYNEIESEKTLQQDPYADEVFGGHCGAIIINASLFILSTRMEISRKDMRLSDMPTYSELAALRNVGKKSLWEYEKTMKEYGFTDKLT